MGGYKVVVEREVLEDGAEAVKFRKVYKSEEWALYDQAPGEKGGYVELKGWVEGGWWKVAGGRWTSWCDNYVNADGFSN